MSARTYFRFAVQCAFACSASLFIGAEAGGYDDLARTPQYFGMCDAGSTGTRLYIFKLGATDLGAKASSVFVKKIKPGLSSYANNPQTAVAPLLKLLVEGAEKVPDDVRSKMPLTIFGTAGMRMLSPEKQAEIWKAVSSGLQNSKEFPFAADRLQARTVSGTEEGLWAVLTTNFLNGLMSHDLLSLGKSSPLGLLDLGGSSTQIALPAATAKNEGADFALDTTVHSYLGFGMTHIQKSLRKTFSENKSKKDGACYMQGAPIDEDLVGTGDSVFCRDLIHMMFNETIDACKASRAQKDDICLGDMRKLPEPDSAIRNSTVDFFAVSGFTYVVDFVRWRLQGALEAPATEAFLKAFPRPTLRELEAAVDIMCKMEYSFVAESLTDEKKRHPFTEKDNAPYRCFQANYIIVLLRHIYGFPANGRSIIFALEADGEDLEWPLGALLHQQKQHHDKSRTRSEHSSEL